ncbi:hypothetical protein [Microbulbifer sp. TRSA007]|uniref:hypothetical protein n=1 Tax=Microbulbifer sp. TRSA007 TaxID=3243384 RepID=UPI004039ABF2
MKYKDRKIYFITIAIVLLTHTALHAISVFAEGINVSYRRIIDPLHLDKVISVNPNVRSSLIFRIKLTPQNTDFNTRNLKIMFQSNGKEYVIQPNQFGAIELPITKMMYTENPDLYISQSPTGGFELGIELAIRNPPTMNINTDVIQEAYSQYNDTIRSIGMMARIFAPKVNIVLLRTNSPRQMCSLLGEKSTINLGQTNLLGELRFPIELIKKTQSTTILCSQIIQEILLETGKDKI